MQSYHQQYLLSMTYKCLPHAVEYLMSGQESQKEVQGRGKNHKNDTNAVSLTQTLMILYCFCERLYLELKDIGSKHF